VTAVFADTFYWIAVTTPDDSAYARALEFSRSRPPDPIVTTDEVLSEYLTFFSGMTPGVRRQAGDNAVALLRNPRAKVMPQSAGSCRGAACALRGASGSAGVQSRAISGALQHEATNVGTDMIKLVLNGSQERVIVLLKFQEN